VIELQDAGVLDEQIHWLTELMPAAVLSGDPLPAAPGFAIPRGGASQRLRRSP
jgi:hypothetical protein